jgi:hypothetical protein
MSLGRFRFGLQNLVLNGFPRSAPRITSLFFNVKVNFRCGAVCGYLLTIKFHL